MKLNYVAFKKAVDYLRNKVAVMLIFTAIFISIFYLIVNFNDEDTNIKLETRFQSLSDNWEIVYSDGTKEENVTLPSWVVIKPNESVTLINNIPNSDEHHNAIITRNYHQFLDAYLDGRLVYRFPGEGGITSRSIITDDWNLISYEDESSHVLKLVFITDNMGFQGNIEAPIWGEDNAVLGHLKQKYALPYILSASLIILGLFMLVVAFIYTRKVLDREQALLGLVFVTVGIWFADRSKMPIFVVGSNVKFFLAFLCLLMVSILLFMHMGLRFKRFHQNLIYLLTILDGVFLIVLFIIVASNALTVHYIIKFVYLSILITCLFFVFLLWDNAYGKQSRYNSNVEKNGAIIEFISAIITIVLSFVSIIWDAIISNNWSFSEREWSGVGEIQMFAIIFFALAQLIILIYKGYHGTLEREIINKKLHDSQLELMMGQIQPHFIFNTLSSIRTLIKVDPDLAYSMVFDFSNYLRANVDNITNLDGIKFAAEVDHIKSYVGIEQVRFGNRLKVEYDIKDSNFNVPPLSIQPLVENAIKHGVCKKLEGGTVWLKSYSDATNYYVEIKDDGVGIDAERLKALLSYDVMDSDYSNKDVAQETLKKTLDLSSIRDDAGQLIQLDDSFETQNVRLIGNGSEVHQSTGLKNIILRLKEISNATVEISSQINHGTTMKVIFPKEFNDEF